MPRAGCASPHAGIGALAFLEASTRPEILPAAACATVTGGARLINTHGAYLLGAAPRQQKHNAARTPRYTTTGIDGGYLPAQRRPGVLARERAGALALRGEKAPSSRLGLFPGKQPQRITPYFR